MPDTVKKNEKNTSARNISGKRTNRKNSHISFPDIADFRVFAYSFMFSTSAKTLG